MIIGSPKNMQAFSDGLWSGFLIFMYCDLLTIGPWGHPSPPKTCWRLKWMVPNGSIKEINNHSLLPRIQNQWKPTLENAIWFWTLCQHLTISTPIFHFCPKVAPLVFNWEVLPHPTLFTNLVLWWIVWVLQVSNKYIQFQSFLAIIGHFWPFLFVLGYFWPKVIPLWLVSWNIAIF